MTTDTTTTTACPTWCTGRHPALVPGTHQGAGWSGYGLDVSIEQPSAGSATIGVDQSPQENLTLTPVQAHELGMALVRAADVLRREAQR
jgi:hypothetical protein